MSGTMPHFISITESRVPGAAIRTSAPLAINPSLYRNLNYDALKDFKPVTLVATVPSLLLVPASSPIRTFSDFLAFAKANPGKLSYGSAGNGTPQHLAMELLKSMAGLRIVHVPYKGGAPAVADLIGAQTDVMFAAYSGDFGLGDDDRYIDLLGMTQGHPLFGQSGYINIDNVVMRVFTLTVPIIQEDAWAQAQ